jgi:hypothetical protein
MAFKLWLWVLEFRLRRRKDKNRIAFLVTALLQELEGQGYPIRSVMPLVIWHHDNKLELQGSYDSDSRQYWQVNGIEFMPQKRKTEQ